MGASGPGGAMTPLGSLRQVRESLANFNTCTDGSPGRGMGTELLHGPGLIVEIATSLDPVSQAIVTLNDEDIAMAVLFRMCKAMGWKMMDMETGRTFG
jgi:hypothetical protein